MRRENRRKDSNNKTFLYIIGCISGIAVIVFIVTLIIYSGTSESDSSTLNTAKVNNIVPNNNLIVSQEMNAEETSSKLGKSIEEAQKSIPSSEPTPTKSLNSKTMKTTPTPERNLDNKNNKSDNILTNKNEKSDEKNNENEENKQQDLNMNKEQKNPVFVKPVDGEVVKEYAKDKLVYSETLKEWITHLGIDIKAEKTSIVKSAADGRVSSIKNDPRYGLTVTVEHSNGFKTIYSNLLTAEFVTVGEEITSGQTIGTIGNTAVFEVSDEDHLHFEILKDNESVDPTIYIQL